MNIFQGMTAAHILQRDAHRYEIKVNIDAWDNVTFELTYEELLERTQDRYQHWVSIAPSQIVNNLRTVINVSRIPKAFKNWSKRPILSFLPMRPLRGSKVLVLSFLKPSTRTDNEQ